jgi:hypothetical protein
LLTVADHSRKLLGAVFVPTDTTWNHFEHFRRRLLPHALPLVGYPDGLSLFGHDSMADDRDPGSEFQRACSALGGNPTSHHHPQPPSRSASSGPWPNRRAHPKIPGRKSWEIIRCKVAPFERAQISPFEPPPTGLWKPKRPLKTKYAQNH